MKVILFEGADKTGKTTAVKQLCSMINVGETEEFGNRYNAIVMNKPYIAYGNESLQFKVNAIDASLDAMFNTILSLRRNFSDDNVVLLIDRLHISELVYAELFNREASHWFDTIDMDLMLHEALLVHCVPDDIESTINKFELDGTIDTLTFDEYRKSIELFDKYVDYSLIDRVVRYTYDDFDSLIGYVAKYLRGDLYVR